MTQKPTKIMSNGEYIKQSAKTLVWGLVGFSLHIVAGICVLLSLSMLWRYGLHPEAFSFDESIQVGIVLLMLGLAYEMYRLGCIGLDKSIAAESVILNRADVIDLPASESLVRASEQSQAPQQAVLLRPATDTQEAPAEQLLRPS